MSTITRVAAIIGMHEAKIDAIPINYSNNNYQATKLSQASIFNGVNKDARGYSTAKTILANEASNSATPFNANPSSESQRFLDLLELASGKKPASGHSLLKDRIFSLTKRATRKCRGHHGGHYGGLGVKNVIKKVETRYKDARKDVTEKKSNANPKTGSTNEPIVMNKSSPPLNEPCKTKETSGTASLKDSKASRFSLKGVAMSLILKLKEGGGGKPDKPGKKPRREKLVLKHGALLKDYLSSSTSPKSPPFVPPYFRGTGTYVVTGSRGMRYDFTNPEMTMEEYLQTLEDAEILKDLEKSTSPKVKIRNSRKSFKCKQAQVNAPSSNSSFSFDFMSPITSNKFPNKGISCLVPIANNQFSSLSPVQLDSSKERDEPVESTDSNIKMLPAECNEDDLLDQPTYISSKCFSISCPPNDKNFSILNYNSSKGIASERSLGLPVPQAERPEQQSKECIEHQDNYPAQINKQDVNVVYESKFFTMIKRATDIKENAIKMYSTCEFQPTTNLNVSLDSAGDVLQNGTLKKTFYLHKFANETTDSVKNVPTISKESSKNHCRTFPIVQNQVSKASRATIKPVLKSILKKSEPKNIDTHLLEDEILSNKSNKNEFTIFSHSCKNGNKDEACMKSLKNKRSKYKKMKENLTYQRNKIEEKYDFSTYYAMDSDKIIDGRDTQISSNNISNGKRNKKYSTNESVESYTRKNVQLLDHNKYGNSKNENGKQVLDYESTDKFESENKKHILAASFSSKKTSSKDSSDFFLESERLKSNNMNKEAVSKGCRTFQKEDESRINYSDTFPRTSHLRNSERQSKVVDEMLTKGVFVKDNLELERLIPITSNSEIQLRKGNEVLQLPPNATDNGYVEIEPQSVASPHLNNANPNKDTKDVNKLLSEVQNLINQISDRNSQMDKPVPHPVKEHELKSNRYSARFSTAYTDKFLSTNHEYRKAQLSKNSQSLPSLRKDSTNKTTRCSGISATKSFDETKELAQNSFFNSVKLPKKQNPNSNSSSSLTTESLNLQETNNHKLSSKLLLDQNEKRKSTVCFQFDSISKHGNSSATLNSDFIKPERQTSAFKSSLDLVLTSSNENMENTSNSPKTSLSASLEKESLNSITKTTEIEGSNHENNYKANHESLLKDERMHGYCTKQTLIEIQKIMSRREKDINIQSGHVQSKANDYLNAVQKSIGLSTKVDTQLLKIKNKNIIDSKMQSCSTNFGHLKRNENNIFDRKMVFRTSKYLEAANNESLQETINCSSTISNNASIKDKKLLQERGTDSTLEKNKQTEKEVEFLEKPATNGPPEDIELQNLQPMQPDKTIKETQIEIKKTILHFNPVRVEAEKRNLDAEHASEEVQHERKHIKRICNIECQTNMEEDWQTITNESFEGRIEANEQKIESKIIDKGKVDEETKPIVDGNEIKLQNAALVKAVSNNNLQYVKKLLALNADPNTKCGSSGGTVLHKAASRGYFDILQVLLTNGANTESRTEYGSTPLHLAAEKGHDKIALHLLSRGADVNAATSYGVTPLQLSLALGHLSTSLILIKHKADFLKQNMVGETSEYVASTLGYDAKHLQSKDVVLEKVPLAVQLIRGVEEGCPITVEKCLEMGANPDTPVPLALHWPAQATVLHRAAHKGDDLLVQLLLRAGSSVNARDVVGNTPLHAGAQRGCNRVVKLLVKSGSDIEATSKKGMTPLHRAASKGKDHTVRQLLKLGASNIAEDENGRTPADWANKRGFKALAKRLQPRSQSRKTSLEESPQQPLKGHTIQANAATLKQQAERIAIK